MVGRFFYRHPSSSSSIEETRSASRSVEFGLHAVLGSTLSPRRYFDRFFYLRSNKNQRHVPKGEIEWRTANLSRMLARSHKNCEKRKEKTQTQTQTRQHPFFLLLFLVFDSCTSIITLVVLSLLSSPHSCPRRYQETTRIPSIDQSTLQAGSTVQSSCISESIRLDEEALWKPSSVILLAHVVVERHGGGVFKGSVPSLASFTLLGRKANSASSFLLCIAPHLVLYSSAATHASCARNDK